MAHMFLTKKKGLFRREVVDIEWKGKTLAAALNSDLTLKESLLTEFRVNRPWNIVVAPEPIYRCMRIETDLQLPSGQDGVITFFYCPVLLFNSEFRGKLGAMILYSQGGSRKLNENS